MPRAVGIARTLTRGGRWMILGALRGPCVVAVVVAFGLDTAPARAEVPPAELAKQLAVPGSSVAMHPVHGNHGTTAPSPSSQGFDVVGFAPPAIASGSRPSSRHTRRQS